jgi:hypothetical protein
VKKEWENQDFPQEKTEKTTAKISKSAERGIGTAISVTSSPGSEGQNDNRKACAEPKERYPPKLGHTPLVWVIPPAERRDTTSFFSIVIFVCIYFIPNSYISP